MKLSERYDQTKRELNLVSSALCYAVIGRVKWSDPKMVTTVGGMPKSMQRVGVSESSDPIVIMHDVDHHAVWVPTLYQVACWPYETVAAFPGLAKALINGLDLSGPVNIHVPSGTWIRRVKEAEERKVVLKEVEL